MHAFEVLSDPVRRRVVELLSEGPRTAGELTSAVRDEFGITQPAVSNQLRILRDSGFAHDQRQGSHRLYQLTPGALDEVSSWVERHQRLWPQRLDALATEVARGKQERSRREDHPDVD